MTPAVALAMTTVARIVCAATTVRGPSGLFMIVVLYRRGGCQRFTAVAGAGPATRAACVQLSPQVARLVSLTCLPT